MRDHHPELPDIALIKNSFFYTKLVQEGYVYANVKSWTRKMGDLLAKDKILVPINQGATHWVSNNCTTLRLTIWLIGASSDQYP